MFKRFFFSTECHFYTQKEYGELNQVVFGINDLKVCLGIFVVSEYQNSELQLIECEENNSNTCS